MNTHSTTERSPDTGLKKLKWTLAAASLFPLSIALMGMLTLFLAIAPALDMSIFLKLPPSALYALGFLVCGVIYIGRLQVREIYSIVLLNLDRFAWRVTGILIGGYSEPSARPSNEVQRKYILLTIATSLLGFCYAYNVLDDIKLSTISYLNDISPKEPLIWHLFKYGTQVGIGELLVLLPLRMLYSKTWAELRDRPSFDSIRKELTRQPDVDTSAPEPEHVVNVAHLSDLHADGLRDESEKSLGWVSSTELQDAFGGVERETVDAVVLSGDLTDNGSDYGWHVFNASLANTRLSNRLVLAPGNHDLNLVLADWWRSLWSHEDTTKSGRHYRARRYLDAAEKFMGTRARVLCPFTGSMSTLTEVMKRARPELDAWKHKQNTGDQFAPADFLELLFPMVVTVETESGQVCPVQFVVWNSVRPNRWAVFNALGRIGKDQADRMSTIAQNIASNQALVHVVHHQVGVPSPKEAVAMQPKTRKRRFVNGGMMLEDPLTLLNWLERRRQRTVLLHGHHHKHFVMGRNKSGLTIVSAPSATVGCEESYVNGSAANRQGRWLLLELGLNGEHTSLRSSKPKP